MAKAKTWKKITVVKEHAGEYGTDELRKNYADNVPGQTQSIQLMFADYVQKPPIEESSMKRLLDLIQAGKSAEEISKLLKIDVKNVQKLMKSAKKENVQEGPNLLNIVKQALKTTVHKRAFKEAVEKYLELLRENKGKSAHVKVADNAVKQFRDITGREVIRFVDSLVKKGKLPATVGSDMLKRNMANA
jgi:transcriptional regulator